MISSAWKQGSLKSPVAFVGKPIDIGEAAALIMMSKRLRYRHHLTRIAADCVRGHKKIVP